MAFIWAVVSRPFMVPDIVSELVEDFSPSIGAAATIGLLVLLGFLTFTSVASDDILPGVPELKGVPFLGVVPTYFRRGMPHLLGQLITVGKDGISYAKVVNKVLVSIQDPDMAREVLAYPEEIASREGDPNRMSWSPFWTFRRLVGKSLFNDVGPDVPHLRETYIREFNTTKTNAEKFDIITKIATTHATDLAGEDSTARIHDIKSCASNFHIAVWGETLYGNPFHHSGDKVLTLSQKLIDLAGDPWPSVWYSVRLSLGMLKAGESSPSEAKLKAKVTRIVESSTAKLEEFERNNPEAPLKGMRNFSMNTGGMRTGPLSKHASEFAHLNIFGGHHSVGLNVSWLLIELDKHPECMTKLMDEIDSADTEDFTTINSKMPYLDAAMMEINRLHPTAHATLRVITGETQLVSSEKPIILKPGMLVYISYLYLHTSPDYWGPDAGAFVPERFLGGHDKSRPFMSFGYGPRACVGYQFAILAAKVYLVALLKTYRMDLEKHNHKRRLGTLLEPSGPVGVKLSRRF